MREIKTAFIPYGTNAARYRVRGATQLRLVLNKNPVVMQREPASLFSSTTIWFMLELYNGSGPSRILFTDDQINFTLRLGGPFVAFVSGRAFTARLLSEPSFNIYSSSSQPFPVSRDDIDFR